METEGAGLTIKPYGTIKDRRVRTYDVIGDYTQLEEFVEWLPELLPNEVYHITLLARNKYCGELTHIKSDREQLRRLTTSKDFIIPRLRQMECPLGTYLQKTTEIPQEALAAYIHPNPRNLEKGAKNTAKMLLDKITADYDGYNPQTIASSCIQNACGTKHFAHFDYDHIGVDKWMKELIGVYINKEAVSIIKTRGGFHVLVKPGLVEDKYKSGWHSMFSVFDLGFAVPTGDMLMPIPGCVQGGFSPFFILKDGIKQ